MPPFTGRKPILIVSQAGELLTVTYVLLNVIFYDAMSADWLIFYGLHGLVGGGETFFAMSTSIISDVSPRKEVMIRRGKNFVCFVFKHCCFCLQVNGCLCE